MNIFVVAEVYGGVLNEITAFKNREDAVAYAEAKAKEEGFQKEHEDSWASGDGDGDMSLWEIPFSSKKKEQNPSYRFFEK